MQVEQAWLVMGAMGLFFIGVLLTLIIIARYVPEFRIMSRFALSQEEIARSSLPTVVRMVLIPTLASILPVIMPLIMGLLEPTVMQSLLTIFRFDVSVIIYVLIVLLASILGYKYRNRLGHSINESDTDVQIT
ncbi:MAG: hypothetical protein EAX95_15680 [Candidatus Thorarchaeota archaeon]|nr:hypothetical protein [Candidatus Thorarchaeota archaeon]